MTSSLIFFKDFSLQLQFISCSHPLELIAIQNFGALSPDWLSMTCQCPIIAFHHLSFSPVPHHQSRCLCQSSEIKKDYDLDEAVQALEEK